MNLRSFAISRPLILALFLSLISSAAFAQGGKFALLIGNGAYRALPNLANPPRDVRLIGELLRHIGFEVEVLVNADRTQMIGAAQRLSLRARQAEVALFFYAGHAMEVNGENILVPVSAVVQSANALMQTSVPYRDISAAIEGRARTTLIFLDSCRDSPIGETDQRRTRGTAPERVQAGTRSAGGGGLAGIASSSGTLIAFATAPGRVALDGAAENSPFTRALAQYLLTPGLEVRQMLSMVRRTVRQMTNGTQIPWDNSSLENDFYFVAAGTILRPLPGLRFQPPLPPTGTLRTSPPSVSPNANRSQCHIARRRVWNDTTYDVTMLNDGLPCRITIDTGPSSRIQSAPSSGSLHMSPSPLPGHMRVFYSSMADPGSDTFAINSSYGEHRVNITLQAAPQ